MIKANELRIGITLNLLKFERVGFNPVTIDKPRLIALLNGEETTYYPVPLTPEILGRCGFEEIAHNNRTQRLFTNSDEYKRFDVKFKIANPSEIFISSTYHRNITHIKYLHQLQNLYFALTGEELEFKQQPATIHSQN